MFSGESISPSIAIHVHVNPTTSLSDELWNKKSIDIFDGQKKGERKKVRCILCIKYPDTVKRLSYNRIIPAIATEAGTKYRGEVVFEHLTSLYHKECVKMEKIKLLELPTPALTPMDLHISKANENKANEIGKMMIHVYTDAKRLNLSAWSWPARYVTAQTAFSFSFNGSQQNQSIIPDGLSLSYVNPPTHLDLLTCIVDADRNSITEKLRNCLALSLRVDGSVDRTQKDKIYILAKIVSSDGNSELIFLGVGEQKRAKAVGLLETVLSCIEEHFGVEFLNESILRKISSMCTDGTNLNSGERGGLWALFEEKMRTSGSETPFLKIWCVVHRSNLAFEDMKDEVDDVNKVLNILSTLSSFFHTSGTRTAELKNIAETHGLNILSMPKIFKIRWTEYIYRLVRAILTSWHALVIYFQANANCAKSSGFLKFITNEHNLRKVSYLGDVLFIFMRMQKKLQNDNLTLIKMCADVKLALTSLKDLIVSPLLGGFEDKLNDSIVQRNGKRFLKNIELNNNVTSRRTTGRGQAEKTPGELIQEYRTKVCNSLSDHLSSRLEIDSDLLQLLDSFISLDSSVDLKKIHKVIGRDLDLSTVYVQFNDLVGTNSKELPFPKLVKFLSSPERFEDFKEVTIMFARILACTPHSADVERCVSANNLLKTNQRSSLSLETENKYLYINFNMPSLEKWCPRPAIRKWLSEKNRRNPHITNSGKTIQQPYFNGVFESAEEENDEELETPTGRFTF